MNRKILALTGAVAALSVGQSWAQQPRGYGEGGECRAAPPGSGEQLCIDQRAWYDKHDPSSAVTQAPTPAPAATPPLDTPPASDVAATDVAPAQVAVNDAPPAPEATPAPTPAASDVSATSASSMAYANIANAPGGVFKAKVGNYKMSAYVSPPRPLPYDQLDAYLSAPKSKQLAQNWWSASELAEAQTAPASNVSATVDQPVASHTEIAGDTPVAQQPDSGAAPTPPAVAEPTLTPDTTQAVDDGTLDGPAYYY